MVNVPRQLKIHLSLLKLHCLCYNHWGPFKCYVTLEGVGGYMPKRYEALRGGGGGGTSALRNVIFLLTLALLGLPSCPRVGYGTARVRRGFQNKLASISNRPNMFL